MTPPAPLRIAIFGAATGAGRIWSYFAALAPAQIEPVRVYTPSRLTRAGPIDGLILAAPFAGATTLAAHLAALSAYQSLKSILVVPELLAGRRPFIDGIPAEARDRVRVNVAADWRRSPPIRAALAANADGRLDRVDHVSIQLHVPRSMPGRAAQRALAARPVGHVYAADLARLFRPGEQFTHVGHSPLYERGLAAGTSSKVTMTTAGGEHVDVWFAPTYSRLADTFGISARFADPAAAEKFDRDLARERVEPVPRGAPTGSTARHRATLRAFVAQLAGELDEPGAVGLQPLMPADEAAIVERIAHSGLISLHHSGEHTIWPPIADGAPGSSGANG